MIVDIFVSCQGRELDRRGQELMKEILGLKTIIIKTEPMVMVVVFFVFTNVVS